MAETPNQIIIKKIKKGGHGHHGGAWKLAYADFVTAMMAFFLLMWLLASTEPVYRKGIAEYFKDPWKASFEGGSSTSESASIIKGGGEDLSRSEGEVQMAPQTVMETERKASEKDILELMKQEEKKQMETLKQKIEDMIQEDTLLNPFREQLKIDITQEGLRVQIIDKEGRPMFDLASPRMENYAAEIIHKLAPLMNEMPNKISISGHTDARPFPGNGQGYTNWELSTDRANAARKEIIKGGLQEAKMLRVVGLASSVPFLDNDPMAATNRRISIILMKREIADEIVRGDSDVNIDAADVQAGRSALLPGTAAPAAPPILPRRQP
jgi:chemotaxis protein MotB